MFRSQYLAENGDLVEAAHEKMCLGRLHESLQYQLQLHQNLMYLATHADDDPALERLVFFGTERQQQQQQEQHDSNGREQDPRRPLAAPAPDGELPVAPTEDAMEDVPSGVLLNRMLMGRRARLGAER